MPSDSQPVSEARSAAARRNGAKSNGPKTPEGKARSSRNALKFGLTSEIAVLPNETKREFKQLHAAFIGRFAPRDVAELALVEQMISLAWRQRRYWKIEDLVLYLQTQEEREWRERGWEDLSENGHYALAFESLGSKGTLHDLVRYENSLRRQFERTLTLLLKFRGAEEKTAKRTQADGPSSVREAPPAEPLTNSSPKTPAVKTNPRRRARSKPALDSGSSPVSSSPVPITSDSVSVINQLDKSPCDPSLQ